MVILAYDLCRHANHVEIYTVRCKKLGIQTNEHIYARTESLESIGYAVQLLCLSIQHFIKIFCSGLKQSTLDGAVVHQPKPPVFTTDGLLDYIIELVVSEDEVSLHGST